MSDDPMLEFSTATFRLRGLEFQIGFGWYKGVKVFVGAVGDEQGVFGHARDVVRYLVGHGLTRDEARRHILSAVKHLVDGELVAGTRPQ